MSAAVLPASCCYVAVRLISALLALQQQLARLFGSLKSSWRSINQSINQFTDKAHNMRASIGTKLQVFQQTVVNKILLILITVALGQHMSERGGACHSADWLQEVKIYRKQCPDECIL